MEGRSGELSTVMPLARQTVDRTPWERESASFPNDLFRSWMDCMTRPFEFFDEVDPEISFVRPILFYLIFSTLGYGMATLSMEATLGGWFAAYDGAEAGGSGSPWGALFWFFLAPFYGMLALALYVGLTHAGVRLFVREPRGIGTTAHGLCYGAAPQVVNIVPFLGWLVSSLWSLFLAIVAVQKLHDTTFGRALAAVVVPVMALVVIGATFFTILVVLVAVAIGGAA